VLKESILLDLMAFYALPWERPGYSPAILRPTMHDRTASVPAVLDALDADRRRIHQ
jgi:hypothetical protein